MNGIDLPSGKVALTKKALELVDACRSSAGMRAAYCRQLNSIIETGKGDGARSLINMLYSHIDRLASHLFSPTDLRFTIDFENGYPPNILEQAKVVGKILTRDWERNNTDMVFGQGVFEALKYGACILKQYVQQEGPEMQPVYYKSLVMPWQFGVYREDVNDLSRQPVMCESVMLTKPEVWRRIYHLPDAHDLMRRVSAHAAKGQAGDEYNSFFHSVLSANPINTGNTGQQRPTPGGIVQLNSDPNYTIVGPDIAVDMVRMHELWVQDGDDYTTIQIVEPDILIAPRYRRANLLINTEPGSGLHPYTLIQPNQVHGYMWGRSEVVDLIEPQGFLSTTADDVKRLFGLQVDKILGFEGDDTMTDERYDQMRGAGYMTTPAGATIKDLTPSFPPEALPMLDKLMQIIDKLGGFDNILSGQGEQGVRAGVHADTLMKTASPRLRDRSLLVERQCAAAGDLRLSIMEAKDPRHYHTDGSSTEKMAATRFLLNDLPEDRRVVVDSHSSSPIFADDHNQVIAFGLKSGFLDGHYAIDHLALPDKDQAQQTLKKKEDAQAAMLKELAAKDPEGFAKYLEKQGGHHR